MGKLWYEKTWSIIPIGSLTPEILVERGDIPTRITLPLELAIPIRIPASCDNETSSGNECSSGSMP